MELVVQMRSAFYNWTNIATLRWEESEEKRQAFQREKMSVMQAYGEEELRV